MWELQSIHQILHHINKNNLCIIGDGTVRDQWAAQVYSFASKSWFEVIHTVEAPVDGDPDHIKKFERNAHGLFQHCHFYIHCNRLSQLATSNYPSTQAAKE